MRSGEVEANLVTLNEIFRLAYIPELVARKLAGSEQSVLGDGDVARFAAEYARLRSELEIARQRDLERHGAAHRPRLAWQDLPCTWLHTRGSAGVCRATDGRGKCVGNMKPTLSLPGGWQDGHRGGCLGVAGMRQLNNLLCCKIRGERPARSTGDEMVEMSFRSRSVLRVRKPQSPSMVEMGGVEPPSRKVRPRRLQA